MNKKLTEYANEVCDAYWEILNRYMGYNYPREQIMKILQMAIDMRNADILKSKTDLSSEDDCK